MKSFWSISALSKVTIELHQRKAGDENLFKLDTTAVQAVKIGVALQESLNSGKKIYFDEVGRRSEKAQL